MPARAGLPSAMPTEDPRKNHIRECQEKYPLRPAEEEMILEAVALDLHKKFGQPLPTKTADQGVKDMQARIAMLKGDKAKTLDAMDGADGHRLAELTKVLNEYNQEIAEAETRLTEYKAQQGLN